MHKYESGNSKNGGCYLSTAVGFVLVLLAIAIAVGVGLIVHFAGGSKEVVCNCPAVSGGQSAGLDAERVKQECTKMVTDGDFEICIACLKTSTPSTTTTATTTPKPKVTDVRLPTSLYPLYYDVELRPNMYEGPAEDFTFDGYVRIQLRCDTATNKITLHTNKLTITAGSVELGAETGTTPAPSIVRREWDKDRQFTVFYLDGMLVKDGVYYVKMNFTGPLKGDLTGLYLSSYERNNQKVYLATTLFAPTDARKAFPCFDEPAIKSYFNITLVRKTHMNSLSNMPIASMESRGNGWIADIYQTSPKMSTYLLAFVVSDFSSLSATTNNGLLYGAWSRPEAVNQTRYALEIGVKVINYYEEYFGIGFPLPKQDMIAIPDSVVGAMENWGLITYRESNMLYTPGVSSEGNKQKVATIVAHELAHQWFGDLVTPSWWDDIWLNEGFASFVEYMGTDFIHPEWKMFEQFVVGDLQYVFGSDGLVTSHPVYVPVSHPDEINEIFDIISYNKGASIIRMMRFFLGEETFRKGLNKYLERKKYDAAFHDDLWQALSEQSSLEGKNVNVKQVMDTWILQMNYPVVMVTREGNNRIRMSQQRYLRDPTAVDPGKYISPFGYKWEIPFTYTSSEENIFNKTDADISWMRKTNTDLIIELQSNIPDQSDNNSWILGNPMQYGYYRVNYDTQNWLSLINQLKTDHSAIHTINRAQIINDAWNLAKAGMLSQDIALQTVEYLNHEMDYVPWRAANRELEYVKTMLTKTGVYGAFQRFMKSKIEVPFNRVGMNNTGAEHLESYIRSTLAGTACSYGVKSCIDESLRLYRQWMTNEAVNPIDPGLKSTVYCTAISQGGVAEWDFAFKQYKTDKVASDSPILLTSMGCAREPWILSRYLIRGLDPDYVRKQDALDVLAAVSSNPIGQGLAWDFFRNKWTDIKRDHGTTIFALARVVGRITPAFNTRFDLEQLQSFMTTNPDLGTGKRAFDQAVERTQANIKWMDTNLETVKTWLANQGYYTE